MRIPNSITRILTPLKNFYSNHNMIAVGVGAVGIGASLYDSNHLGKRYAKKYKQNANANAGLEYFNNTQYLDNKSHLISKIKKKMFKWELANTVRGSEASSRGYTNGLFTGLFRNTIPLALSVASLVLKGKKALIPAGCLGLYALASVTRHGTDHLDSKI